MWEGVLATAERIVIGAYMDDVPAGFIIAGPTPEDLIEKQDGHVWALYIARAAHRQGIGRVLMNMAARKWLERGGHTFTVGVLRANAPARAFYEALGAVAVKESVYDWDGHPLKDCTYFLDTAQMLKVAAAVNPQPPRP
nr:GNAT family N-acetyltransferase [Aestuariivirga litoralis]